MRTLLLAVVLLVAVGCGGSPAPVYTEAATVSKLARTPVPPSATNIYCRTDRDDQTWYSFPQPDHRYWGRFDIPAADLPLVLAVVQKDVTITAGGADFSNDARPEAWWHPEELRNRKVVMCGKSSFWISLLYGDAGTEGVVRVYFFNSES